MKKKKWIQTAIKHKGYVHKLLGIPTNKKINIKKLNKAIVKFGKLYKKTKNKKYLKIFKRLVLARTLIKLSKKRSRSKFDVMRDELKKGVVE